MPLIADVKTSAPADGTRRFNWQYARSSGAANPVWGSHRDGTTLQNPAFGFAESAESAEASRKSQAEAIWAQLG